jgi:signal transduction histidine kinase
MEIGIPLNYQLLNEQLGAQVRHHLGENVVVPEHISNLLAAVSRTYNEMNNGSTDRAGQNRPLNVQNASDMENPGVHSNQHKYFEQFLHIVSHNLKGPVANIKGLCSIIQGSQPGIPDYDKCILGLNSSVSKLDQMISDLVNMQQQIIRNEYTKEPVHVGGMINEIRAMLAHVMDKEKAQITLELEIQEIVTVKSYLFSTLYNLVINSIRYQKPSSGVIINITSSAADGKVILCVKDNGIGIDLVKHKQDLFGMYKKFHNHPEGRGLGLFMVRSHVELLGGTVSARSQPGHGTEFTIELPVI